MKKIKFPVVSIILYVVALIIFAYALWATIYSAQIVKEAVELGQLIVAGSEFEVVSYYMTNVSQPYLFAFVLFALGWILQTIKGQEESASELEDDLDAFEETLEEVVEDATDDFKEVQ